MIYSRVYSERRCSNSTPLLPLNVVKATYTTAKSTLTEHSTPLMLQNGASARKQYAMSITGGSR